MTADLQAAIRRIGGGPGTSALPLLAQTADVDRRLISRVLAGQPINASAYLKLCGALGLDPVTGETVPVVIVGEIDWRRVAGELALSLGFTDMTLRTLAKLTGMAPSTLSRATHGNPISAEHYLALCRVGGIDPLYFTKGFTGNIPSNTSENAA